MKSLLCIPLLCLLSFTTGNDFRQLKWGMTISEVAKAETLKLEMKIGGKLKYSHNLTGIDFTLIYEFKEERFYKAIYTSKEIYLDKNDYIKDYNSLKGLLIKKYGTPKETQTKWSSEQNKADPGKALSAGQVRYNASWKTDRTNIDILLKGFNQKCYFTITYEALDTKWNTMDKEKEQQAIDDL